MSLLVWLPLTQSGIVNQGLRGDLTFSIVNNNSQITTNSDGKIGPCYERIVANTTADIIRSSSTIQLTGDFSMCCWAKITSVSSNVANGVITNHDHTAQCGAGIIIHQPDSTNNPNDYRVGITAGTGSSRTYKDYYGTTNIKDQWHHMCLTFRKSDNKLTLYVDGVAEKSITYAVSTNNTYFDIFNWSTTYYTYKDYHPKGMINDVRLYDHCLSQKEINLISQALVAHYQLHSSELDAADCSGYKNHGTIKGTLSVDSSSARYKNCIKFDGASCIACGRGPMVTDALTVNIWAYMSDWSTYSGMRLASCTESGGWNFEGAGYFICYAGTAYQRTSSSFASLSAGWHMITGTFDGYQAKIYIDGVLKSQSTALTAKTPIKYHASNGIFIGAEAASSTTTPANSACYFNGKISDVRIYGTALKEADILNLYQTRVSIGDDGTMYAYEFIEDNPNNSKITETGLIRTVKFIEDSSVKFLNDKSIKAYNIYEI